MRRFRVLALAVLLAAASLTGCGVRTVRTDVVIVNAGEPQNPLIPTNTNDSNGGRIVDRLFAGLMSYDAKGAPTLEVAQSSRPPTTSITGSRSNPAGRSVTARR